MRISASSLLLRVGTLGGLWLVGCAALGCARVDAEMKTQIDALAQTTAAVASNVNQLRTEMGGKIDGVGNSLSNINQNFDPATMQAVARNSRDAIYMVAIVILFECIVAAVFVVGLFRAVAAWLAGRKKGARQ